MSTNAGDFGHQRAAWYADLSIRPPDAIYRAWRAARFELVTSTAQLDELRRVSRYPKLKTVLPAHRISTMVKKHSTGHCAGHFTSSYGWHGPERSK